MLASLIKWCATLQIGNLTFGVALSQCTPKGRRTSSTFFRRFLDKFCDQEGIGYLIGLSIMGVNLDLYRVITSQIRQSPSAPPPSQPDLDFYHYFR